MNKRVTESPYPMLPVPEALDIVLAEAQALAPVALPLDEAHGRILAQEVKAREPLPPFPASVKDGYAVVAADGPGVYPLTGEVTAGRIADFAVDAGTVAYITTGAAVPGGADAVVMIEETEQLDDNKVRINATVQAGDDVRPVGVDVAKGQVVLAAGERIDPAETGLLATVGAGTVQVYPRPRVAVLSTGDELVEPDQPIDDGQIRDSNRAMLKAAIVAAGSVPVDLGISKDVRKDIEGRIERGLSEADVLLTSGGVSMGDLDLLKGLLHDAGTVHFGRLLMKPGKPLTFATAEVEGRKKLIFGLPGNPVSSMVTFYLMVVPALRKLAGWPNPHLRKVQATLAQPLRLDPQRPEFHRATLIWDGALNGGSGGYLAASTGSQASSRLLSMRSANALLALPQREGMLDAGSTVDALLIGDLP